MSTDFLELDQFKSLNELQKAQFSFITNKCCHSQCKTFCTQNVNPNEGTSVPALGFIFIKPVNATPKSFNRICYNLCFKNCRELKTDLTSTPIPEGSMSLGIILIGLFMSIKFLKFFK